MHQDYPDPLEFYDELGPIAQGGPRCRRESFVPIGKFDLMNHLSSDPELNEAHREAFRRICEALDDQLHREFHVRFDELKALYAHYDPDADTRPLGTLSDTEHGQLAVEVFERVAELLQRANFRRMSQEEIENAVEAASDWGMHLDVDFSRFERLLVFSRGDVIGRRVRRRWVKFYRPEPVEVATYQRLAIVFRLRTSDFEAHEDTSKIYLKLFKNVPKYDIDMLLPGTRIKMSWFDRIRIALPTITGLVMALFKIVQGAVVLAVVGIYGFLALLGFVGGTLGYAIRGIMGYMQTKNRYQLNLTRSLYFQNLASNAGVLFRILDEAEEQEFREALLAYYVLWRRGPLAGMTRDEIDREAEDYLLSTTHIDVDFEILDALGKLERLGLIEPGDQEHWRCVPPEEYLRRHRERNANTAEL